jgi:DNA-binding MarR family transcriptional regulator
MQQRDRDRREIVEAVVTIRRAVVREMLVGMTSSLSGTDLTLVQLATLLLLLDKKERSVKEIAEHLGRSVSAASRMLENLVKGKLIKRREDPEDRRVRLVAIAPGGEKLLAAMMDKRVDAQLALMELLTAEERATVIRGMSLLAEAARRKNNER